jgi:hypothetical protein
VAWAVWLVETDAVTGGNESDGLFADRSMGGGGGDREKMVWRWKSA